MNRNKVRCAGLLVVLTCLAGCSRGPGLNCWFVDSLEKIFPDDPVGARKLEGNSFAAARNSNLSIQLALRSSQTAGDLYLDALALTGPGMPIETMRVRWVEYVVVTSNTPDTPEGELLRKAPALFPDPLLEQFPITLKKGETRSVWVTVRVPAGQQPGQYRGALRLRQGTETLATIPYALRVSKATVPSRTPLAVTNHFTFSDDRVEQFYGCTRYSAPWWSMIASHARFLAGYRQNSIGANPVTLAAAEPAGGGLRYNFANFERFVETFEAAGVEGYIEGGNLLSRQRRPGAPVMLRAWLIEDGKAVLRDIPHDDARARRFLETFLPALRQCLERRGWSRKYLQGILDEPNQREVKPFVETAGAVRKLLPGVRTIEPVGARQDLGFMRKTVDIWVPMLGTFDDKLDLLRQHVSEDGGELWFYTCLSPRGRYPNRFIDYALLKTRLLHWMNFKLGFRGYLHWGGNYWGPEPFKDTQPVINEGSTYLPPGDAFVTYPNRLGRSLYSSIRLEQMREGIEDYGLLDELAKKDAARAAQIAGEAVPSQVDYLRDPRQFRKLHQRLLDAF